MIRSYFGIPPVDSKLSMDGRVACIRCGSGTHIHQHRDRDVSDPRIERVEIQRRQCKSCHATFTVRPVGITQARATNRTKALALVWYLLGLSYDGVVCALEAQGMTFSKASVWGWVQALWEKAADLRRRIQRGRIRFVGLDGTVYKVAGSQIPVQFLTDLLTGQTLEIHFLTEEDKDAMAALMKEVKKRYDVEMITTDDAGAYRAAAQEVGLPQQLCVTHAKKSLARRRKSLLSQAREEQDPRLETLQDMLALLREKALAESPDVLHVGGDIYRAFRGAKPPGPGQKASLEYRMYLLGLTIMEEWPRIFADRPHRAHFALDGTNNATERAIGLGGKIRYRSMRGFKSRFALTRYLGAVQWLRCQQTAARKEGFISLNPLFN